MRSLAKKDTDIIHECREHAVRLLKANCTPQGINAAAKTKRADSRHYASVFGRDAAICSLGMAVSGDPRLRTCAKRSLLTLGRYQARNGQIPKFVKPETEEVDFWYAGCIDATLWWLIAVDFYDRHVPDSGMKTRLHRQIELAVYWLQCQEHPGLHLVQQNEASDWADIMPRSGFVLYSNALWYRVKKLYAVPDAEKTRHNFKHLFYPYDKTEPENRRARILSHYVKERKRRSDCYLSFVNFSFWGPEVDVYANVLSMLFGLSPLSRSKKRVGELVRLKINEPWPVKVVHAPIRSNSPLWRTYMKRYNQNFPHQYHNGGIWPFVAGFWIILLLRLNMKKLARQELVQFAKVNSVNNWEFNEWFHGKTGKPMGMAGQSWNAAMFILAYHSMENTIYI